MQAITTKTSESTGVREALRKKRGLVLGGVIVMVGIAVWTMFQQMHSGVLDQSTMYCTVDDGQSWFTDSAAKFTPFDYGGKQAVQAHLFDCDGEHFVAYLSRYTADAKAVLEKTRELEKQDPNHVPSTLGEANAALNHVEYKKPGDATWTRKIPPLTRKRKNGTDPFEIMPWGPVNPLDAPQ